MNKVKIVVDSTVDLSEELYKKLDLLVLPLNVNFGEETFRALGTKSFAELMNYSLEDLQILERIDIICSCEKQSRN